MELDSDIGNEQIIKVLEEYPEIGDILEKHDIGCVKCSIGTCLLKDVVTVHFLGKEIEAQIETDINSFLNEQAKRRTS